MKQFVTILTTFCIPLASAQDAPTATMPVAHRPMLETHCFKCHNADKQKGRVRLDDLPFMIGDIEAAER